MCCGCGHVLLGEKYLLDIGKYFAVRVRCCRAWVAPTAFTLVNARQMTPIRHAESPPLTVRLRQRPHSFYNLARPLFLDGSGKWHRLQQLARCQHCGARSWWPMCHTKNSMGRCALSRRVLSVHGLAFSLVQPLLGRPLACGIWQPWLATTQPKANLAEGKTVILETVV